MHNASNQPSVETRNAELQGGFEPLRTVFAIAALLLGFIAAAHATGSGEIDVSGNDGVHRSVASFSTQVNFEVHGLVAEVQVHQRFRNDGAAWLEGQYLLPLPERAAVHGLRLHVGERVIVGEIREKEQARSEFAQAVASGQKASLVEAQSANLFRTAIANVAPGEVVEVDIEYWQQVQYRNGEFSLSFPLTYTPRYEIGEPAAAGFRSASEPPADAAATLASPTAAPEVAISVELDAGLPLTRVESPTHAIDIREDGDRRHIRLQQNRAPSDRDFVLNWTPRTLAAPAAAVFTERLGDETFALLMLVPPSQPTSTLPRELILVIDTSGSMEGASMVQARAALDIALSHLSPRDRFNVIEFNSTMNVLFDSAVAATAGDVQLAREWVAQLKANGGTEMRPALLRAMQGSAPEGYVRQIVFATDGAVENADELYAAIETNLANSRLFPVGIGSAPNAHFLSKAAQMGRGSETVIRDLNDVGERMQALIEKLDRPALRDLQLTWPGTAEVYPQRVPDLYHGEPLIVVARTSSVSGTVQAQGWLSNDAWTKRLDLDLRGSARGISHLWARNKIDAIDDALMRGGDEPGLRQQMLDVALKFHLVSRYTSLVAIDKTPQRPPGSALQSTQIANATPDGSVNFAQTATDAPLKILLGLLALLTVLALGRTRANTRQSSSIAA
ncbi:MAG: marine proteobacterial sortase target protein [Tahibacter sp.]